MKQRQNRKKLIAARKRDVGARKKSSSVRRPNKALAGPLDRVAKIGPTLQAISALIHIAIFVVLTAAGILYLCITALHDHPEILGGLFKMLGAALT